MKRISSDWLLRLAWACPIVIFVCMLIGWRLSNRLYTDVDGAFAKWNFEYAFEWGHWFDLAIFNPFAGLGSTFWSNTPWLNPGAWALQLPFSLYCGPVLRHPAGPIQAANFRSAIAF